MDARGSNAGPPGSNTPDPFAGIVAEVARAVTAVADALAHHVFPAVVRAANTDRGQWVLHNDVDAWAHPDGGR